MTAAAPQSNDRFAAASTRLSGYMIADKFEKTITATDDADSTALRTARIIARGVRQAAADKKIALDGSQRINPAHLSPHIDNLVNIFNRVALSENYHAWQAERRRALAQSLASDPSFPRLLSGWRKAPGDILLETATTFTKTYQRLYEVPATTVPFRVTWLRAGCGYTGEHRAPAPGKTEHCLAFNVGKDSEFRDPAIGLNALHHENTHATQTALAAAFRHDRIKPDHPLYRDARLLFMLTEETESYILHTPAYHAHPLERDAFDQADDFITDLKAALKIKGVSPLLG
ncbi:MAG: hypothetical protein KJ667_08115 [Alphaproteobacteria bacterium]|nr:hypothetical protein [Alphaproteobacteria bacterium]